MAHGHLATIKALNLELSTLQNEKVAGFVVNADDSDQFKWNVAIFGPPDSIYSGGYFKNGDVCISILHPPVDDPQSGEHINERWNPTQNVRTVLLSVISLLNEPNISSPANVDASIHYRKWKESNDREYPNIVRKQVLATKSDAIKDGVFVPETIQEYCQLDAPSIRPEEDYDFDLCGIDDEVDSNYEEDDEDSGNEES